MHLNQQQSIGDMTTGTGNNTTQLLQASTFKQKSLVVDKICTEVSRLINNIITNNEDDATEHLRLALKVRKSMSSGNLLKFVTDLRKLIAEELIDALIHQLVEKYTTEEQRKAFIKEVCEVVLNPFPGFRIADNFVQILNKTHVTEKSEEQQVTEMQLTTEGQVTEVPQIKREQQTTEWQQATMEVPQVTEVSYNTNMIWITTESPQVTGIQRINEREQVTEVPQITRGQQTTTERQQITEGQRVTEIPQVTQEHQVTREVQQTMEMRQQVTEKHHVTRRYQVTEVPYTAKGQQIREEQQVTREAQRITEGQQTTTTDNNNDDEQTTERLKVTTEVQQATENQQVVEDYSNTSLHLAVAQGNLNAVKYFVERGADINAKDGNGNMPLHLAAANGLLDIVKYLVEKGVNIHAKDTSRYSALQIAVLKDRLDVVKYLVEKGAYVNDEGGYYFTSPLYDAAKIGSLDIAKYLIANGANLRRGGTATLFLAVKKGDLDLVKHIVEKDVDIINSSIVQTAIEEEKFDIAIFLVESGADITIKNEVGYTILHQAAEKGSLDLVKHLVEKKGIDVNIRSRYSNTTPLHVAVESSNLDLVKYLVEKGAHINNVNNRTGTPLHTAVSKGNLEVVKYLVNAGANVNMKDADENTPLHLAAKNGSLDIVKYLIQNGANSKAIDNDGKTPLDLAAQDCRLDIVEQLTEIGQQVTTEEQQVASKIPLDEGSGHVDIVGFSTEERQQVTERPSVTCEDDNTSLHSAAKDGELDKVKCLIEKGADINAKDESGLTPLHQAVIYKTTYGRLDIVKYLVENGADINVKSGTNSRSFLEDGIGIGSKSKKGRTPLHYAAIHGYTSFSVTNGRISGGCLYGNLDLVKYLVKKGADLTARDEDGRTPLDLANRRCNPQVVEFLSLRCRGRNRRDIVPNNSWMSNSIVNWVKDLISSTSSPALLTSREHNRNTVTAVQEINTTVVNNTLLLGILAAGLFNKTQYKQPIHESLLSPREQLMKLNNMDEEMIMRAIRKGEEKFGDPKTEMDEVKISGNKTGMWK